MRNQSYAIEQPAVKSHNYLTLLQDEQMALPDTCIQNAEAACETGFDDNHSDLQRILEDLFEMNMNCEQYEGGIDGIVKYLQDPRPLNTIALEQYFGHSSSSTDEESCPSSVTPSCIKAKSRKRDADGDDRGHGIISEDPAATPKRFRREAKTKASILRKKSKCSSPSALTKRQATQTKQDEEELVPKTLDAFSPVTCSSGIDHLKELKNHVSHFGSNTHFIPVKKDDSVTKGTVVLPPAGFQLPSSSTVPQHIISIPINGIICFVVLNENSQNLEIATLLQTAPDHSQRGSMNGCIQNVSVIPGNASPVISNAASPASSVSSPTTPEACSPQSDDFHWSQETTMGAQPVDVPITPLSVGSEGPGGSMNGCIQNVSVIPGNASPVISNAASPASSVSSPTTPEACSPQSDDFHWSQETTMGAQPVDVPITPLSVGSEGPEGVEDCIKMVKEYLKDMTQHSYICHEHDEMLLEDIYVDVSMVEVQAETESRRNSTRCLDKECRIYDIAERERRAVNMGNLFHISGKKQKETKVIALLGRAGIGKSVIVQKICQDWVNGSFRQFSFVFWFKCRTLNFTKQYTLKDLLFQPFLPSLKNRDEVFQYLCQYPCKVLLVFDDFEDLQDPDGLLQLTASSSAEKPCKVKELLAGILQKKLLKGCTVLVTARPKETFNQYLGKVDKIVEVLGFSPAHVQEFLHSYFEDHLVVKEVVSCLQHQPYMLSLCHIPLLCRFICFVLKGQCRHGEARLALPPTLTDLFLDILQILLCFGAPVFPQSQNVTAAQKHSLLEVSKCAFAGVQRHECVCTELSRSTKMSNFALNHGLLRPFLKSGEVKEQECGKTFSHSSLQNFLGALHLLYSEEIRCKGLTKNILLQHKRRKSQADWLDIVRRFLTGLAYREGNAFLNCLSGCSKANVKSKKQKCLRKYFSELEVNSLSASNLLELCHCAYEAQSVELTAQVAAKLSEKLSFRGTRLTPSDILVLLYVMQRAPSNFAIDLRDTSIDLQGIEQFIKLKNVTSFRVSICDAVKLWEHLEQTELHELLHLSLVKFSVNPFEVKSLKDIDDLDLLVQIHKERRFLSSALRTSRDELQGLPAVRSLQVLEFALGPVNGPQGFQKLTKILPSLVFLKYLDLEGPSSQKVKMSENKIGDKGAERLAEVLSHLTCLEKLIFSRNQIADRGAQELARSLPNLKFLRTLSLYDNIIGDKGAEKLAEILPVMKSLKVLDVKFNKITDVGAQRLTQSLKQSPHIEKIWMWSPTITHWMSEHIQQIDVRINLQ